MQIPNNAQILIVAVGVAFLISILATWRSQRRPTIQRFFWGDQNLTYRWTTHLLVTGSFSLNGLLYQIWLGYNIGILSLLLQLVWCLSFFLLSRWSHDVSRVADLGTMHGIINQHFSGRAAKLAAMCSIIGAACMIGWELTVGIKVFSVLSGGNTQLSLLLAAIVVIALLTYTLRGGLRANLRANIIQNLIKAAGLISVFAFFVLSISPQARNHLVAFDSWKLLPDQLAAAVTSLTVMGLITNLTFSFFWQFAEMQTWQNLSATKALGDHRRKALIAASVVTFFFPGVLGTLIGVSLGYIPGLSDNTVLTGLISALSDNPALVFLLFVSFACAMLSTADGYCLAAAQSFTWDISRKQTVQNMLSLGVNRDATEDDSVVISDARVVMTIVTILGSGLFLYLVFALGISLFDLVYFVVIAQMAMVPLMLGAIHWQRYSPQRQASFRSGGFWALLCGLLAGMLSAVVAIRMARVGVWAHVYTASCLVGAIVTWVCLRFVKWRREGVI